MPLYEYKCDKCGKVIEVRQKFSDAPLETHENCGGHVERLISRSAFQLKGSGWYATDYAGKSGNGSTKSESASSSSKDSSSDTAAKTESKSSEAKPAESKPAASDASKKSD
jgi:putative FmdB family regulatory protein